LMRGHRSHRDAHASAWDRRLRHPSPNMPTYATALVVSRRCLPPSKNEPLRRRGTTRPSRSRCAPWVERQAPSPAGLEGTALSDSSPRPLGSSRVLTSTLIESSGRPNPCDRPVVSGRSPRTSRSVALRASREPADFAPDRALRFVVHSPPSICSSAPRENARAHPRGETTRGHRRRGLAAGRRILCRLRRGSARSPSESSASRSSTPEGSIQVAAS